MARGEGARSEQTDSDQVEFDFTVIPLDSCPRCFGSVEGWAYSMPVAIAGDRDNTVVRYACPRCRLLYDMSYDLDGLADGWSSYGPMPDRLVPAREGVESHTRNGVDFPVGPVAMLGERSA